MLVERRMADSREKAHAMVLAGDVSVGEQVIAKPATLVPDDATIKLRQRAAFVSRGGTKLEHALEQFDIDSAGVVALDVGASTGGFTDCLLKRGAERVYAVDVGYGQLDYRLRVDHRVTVMERVNARYRFNLPEQVDLITVDVSFISLKKVIPTVSKLAKSRGRMVCLVKPQFEAGRSMVEKGGLIKDPAVHSQVLGDIISWAIEAGYRLRGLTPSPILGAEGNREFFVLLEI